MRRLRRGGAIRAPDTLQPITPMHVRWPAPVCQSHTLRCRSWLASRRCAGTAQRMVARALRASPSEGAAMLLCTDCLGRAALPRARIRRSPAQATCMLQAAQCAACTQSMWAVAVCLCSAQAPRRPASGGNAHHAVAQRWPLRMRPRLARRASAWWGDRAKAVAVRACRDLGRVTCRSSLPEPRCVRCVSCPQCV